MARTIEVEIPAEEEFRQQILEAAVRFSLGYRPNDEDEEAWGYSPNTVVKEIRREAINQCVVVIRGRVAEIVDEALSMPFQETKYGDPVGEPTTLKQKIIDEAVRQMTTKRSGYRNEVALAEHVGKVIEEEWKKQLKGEAEKAATQIRKKLGKKLTDTIDDAVRRVLKDPLG